MEKNMTTIDLKNKPLVESIFEFRWKLEQPQENVFIDPHYQILIGQVFEKVKDKYGRHIQLPQAAMPIELAGHVVQHQFRAEKDGWPLIQIGPGIITLNETEKYIWKDFQYQVDELVNVLYDVYPNADENLKPTGLMLRYIDAYEFDFDSENIFEFLSKHLKAKFEISQDLFEDKNAGQLPHGFDLKFVFPLSDPPGGVHLRFVRGQKNDKDALIWETQVQSKNEDAPTGKEDIIKWVNSAHKLTHGWFFKMIEGRLLEEFK